LSTGEKTEHGDGEITQGRNDVLRGSDIIPSASSAGKTNQTPADSAKAEKSESGDAVKSDIPQFDLANDIMAEQRKITAVRRKGPGSNKAAAAKEKKPVTIEAAPPAKPAKRPERGTETDKIIADIVRRDIERLCKGFDGG